jgi:hypothetical protein
VHVTLTALLFVYALAVARVTRLINEDVLLDVPREKVVSWAWKRQYGEEPSFDAVPVPFWQSVRANRGAEPKLAYLITCPACSSIYVGAVAAPVWYWWGTSPWALIPAVALAFSYTTWALHSWVEN